MNKEKKIIEETDALQERLDKIIKKKSEQTIALKKLLEKLDMDKEQSSSKQ